MIGWMDAFIDESGDRSLRAGSEHFILSAVMVHRESRGRALRLLAELRSELGRQPGQILHYKNFNHSDRLHVGQRIGGSSFLGLTSVVICKRQLWDSFQPGEDHMYLQALRLLMERMSWVAQHQNRRATYTLAHIKRFKLETLRADEAIVRASPQHHIAWPHLNPKGGSIRQPGQEELLQLADSVASGTAQAFERDRYGNTERRYLEAMAPRLYRGRTGDRELTSYGLKLLPSWPSTKAAYPWLAAL